MQQIYVDFLDTTIDYKDVVDLRNKINKLQKHDNKNKCLECGSSINHNDVKILKIGDTIHKIEEIQPEIHKISHKCHNYNPNSNYYKKYYFKYNENDITSLREYVANKSVENRDPNLMNPNSTEYLLSKGMSDKEIELYRKRIGRNISDSKRKSNDNKISKLKAKRKNQANLILTNRKLGLFLKIQRRYDETYQHPEFLLDFISNLLLSVGIQPTEYVIKYDYLSHSKTYKQVECAICGKIDIVYNSIYNFYCQDCRVDNNIHNFAQKNRNNDYMTYEWKQLKSETSKRTNSNPEVKSRIIKSLIKNHKEMPQERKREIANKRHKNMLEVNEDGVTKYELRSNKIVQTKLENGIITVLPDKEKNDYYQYRVLVSICTNSNDITTLKNWDKRGKKTYHLDHIFPISLGFKYNISPYLIGNICNLEMIQANKNRKKSNYIYKIPEEIKYYLREHNIKLDKIFIKNKELLDEWV